LTRGLTSKSEESEPQGSSTANSDDLDNRLQLLLAANMIFEANGHEIRALASAAPRSKKMSLMLSDQKRKARAQEAWMYVFNHDLSKIQRKVILERFSQRIVPWFPRIEMLADFLTDSFDLGGSTSLLALSGLFHLIQERNLDYPHFYSKLYSLLTPDLLHSKHRSRTLRLLDTFLGSTHLPGTLVASFIKRLSRLCLQAPPAGIVVIVPWIYNLLKSHPTCTFMIHRKRPTMITEASLESIIADDPFVADESDPLVTEAIDSSLWEIETLQSHFHPNVAFLAKIISEQFTKQLYNLEDFLDHSYESVSLTDLCLAAIQTLIQSQMTVALLSKNMKKAPVVEYEIPKEIFAISGAGTAAKSGIVMETWAFEK
jgi:U3 small nucleolar RNA-associated protein 19